MIEVAGNGGGGGGMVGAGRLTEISIGMVELCSLYCEDGHLVDRLLENKFSQNGEDALCVDASCELRLSFVPRFDRDCDEGCKGLEKVMSGMRNEEFSPF